MKGMIFMKKLLVLAALLLVTGLLATGCGRAEEPEANTTEPTSQEAAAMSTEALVQAALDSPDVSCLYLYTTYRSGVQDFAQRSPAAAELLARPDNARVLLDAYRGTDPPTGDSDAAASSASRLDVLGILLAQPEVTANMDSSLRAEMTQAAAEKDAELAAAANPINTYREAQAEQERAAVPQPEAAD